MTSAKPIVIVTRKLPQPVETRMRELFDARLNVDDTPMTRRELIRGRRDGRRAGADRHRPDRPRRALPGRPAAEAHRQFRHRRRQYRPRRPPRNRGIIVTNTPGVLTEDTADMTMALILAVPRRLAEGAKLLNRRRRLAGLVADLDARPPHLAASGSASSAWGASARRWRAAPGPSACRSTITTGAASAGDRGRAGGDLLGEPRPDAGAMSTSSRSIARTRRRPITCCRRGG